MGTVWHSRVRQKADLGGAGDFAFTVNSANVGMRRWEDVYADGDKILCCAEDGPVWEISTGVWDTTTKTITGRTFVESSTGSAVSFVGYPIVFSDVPGYFFSALDAYLNLMDGIGTWRLSDGILLGKGYIDADSPNAVVIGIGDDSGTVGAISAPNSVTIGSFSLSGSGGTVAIGAQASAMAVGATAVGYVAAATADTSFALGAFSSASAVGACAIGSYSVAGGSYSFAMGAGAVTSADFTICIGGDGNGQNSTPMQGSMLFGNVGVTEFKGEVIFSQGAFAAAGDIKSSQATLMVVTANATPLEMHVQDGTVGVGADFLILADHSTSFIELDLVARKSATGVDHKAWKVQFAIVREANAAGTFLVGTVTKTQTWATIGAATWDVNVTADTTNGRPAIKVTGQASTNIRWGATLKMTQVKN